ncbi:chemotaxis protein CheX [Sporolituus thermophilus]|uniref:Chemotaxis protein CheX n=1 Tax=Sporolituus thermophilus DSM 23256 TaxID=1123285 RepID=A0A1G7JTB8_9FIRM|nr:chemotaxis protein CheX [Sporolituus thermophilus]SDF28131.1 chemotaxis protein CheX [Sporolituus thermophilus DSM 23256]
MDVKLVAPFVEGVANILPQFGFTQVRRGKLALKDKLIVTMDVNVLIGLNMDLHGNVAYAMDEATAKKVASRMMMGMPVDELNELAQSAVAELANMVAAQAVTILEGIGKRVNISPPTLVMGKNVTVRMSRVKTLVVEMITEDGTIEINIGLEV